jgi:hypothetical protein
MAATPAADTIMAATPDAPIFTGHVTVFAIPVTALAAFAILATDLTATFGVGNFSIGDTGTIR